MKLTINNKEYALRLLCGKVRELSDAIGSKDLLGTLMKAAPENDVETLAKAFRVMCIIPRLSNGDEVCQIIDEYLAEDHTVMDFGNVLMEVLDDSGFLPRRGMSATFKEQTDKAMEQFDEKLSQAAETLLNQKEFTGYKG